MHVSNVLLQVRALCAAVVADLAHEPPLPLVDDLRVPDQVRLQGGGVRAAVGVAGEPPDELAMPLVDVLPETDTLIGGLDKGAQAAQTLGVRTDVFSLKVLAKPSPVTCGVWTPFARYLSTPALESLDALAGRGKLLDRIPPASPVTERSGSP